MIGDERKKRDSKFMKSELKRVLGVGFVSFGMLLVLFIIDKT
jgi:phosphate starvation-inducible membrane PsiE